MLRVLFIAPVAPGLPSLAWHNELAGLADIQGVEVSIVAGDAATISNVSKRLTQESWDAIIFSGHGQANMLILSDNRRVSGDWLATQAKARAPEVIVVGACMSADRDDGLDSIGEAISNAGLHAIVFDVDVDDLAGAVFSTEFVRAMAAVFDVTRACRVASEMASQVDQKTAKGVRLMRAAVNGWRQFSRRFDALECNIVDINARLARLEKRRGA